MTDLTEPAVPAEPSGEASSDPHARLVPVTESVRYRRRAQQAERRVEQLEQQLRETQTLAESRQQELSTVQSQQQALSERLARTEQSRRLEKVLDACGVIDAEAAQLLLERSAPLPADADDSALRQAVEGLLAERPYLRGPACRPLPGATASPRTRSGGPAQQVAEAARQAAQTGNRRDLAQYLRLRRQVR